MAITAFVTGGTGFLGSNIVAELNDLGIQARVLRRENSSLLALEGLTYETTVGDILDRPEKLAKAMEGCDWVFHVAALADYWRQNHGWLHAVNVGGTKNILAAAKMAGVQRFVFTGSASVLGSSTNGQPLNEESPSNLKREDWPYAHTKYLAELEVRKACDDGLACTTVLPAAVIGPRDTNLVSGSIIVEAARGWVKIYPPGGGNFVAVADVASGHIAAAEAGQVGERYILGGENLTFKQVADIVSEVVGRPAPRIRIPPWIVPPMALAVSGARFIVGNRLPFDARVVRLFALDIYYDSSKARQELGYSITPFRVAAQRAYDWYNSHGFIANPSKKTE